MQNFQSTKSFEIGMASTRDVPQLVKLALSSMWQEYSTHEEAEREYKDQVAVRWQRQLETGHARILVAKILDQVVGFAVFRWWFGWNGWLENIVVDEKHRRKGIASDLMRTLTEKARSEGYRAICFAVKSGEESSPFWQKFKLQEFGELPDTDLGQDLQLFYMSV